MRLLKQRAFHAEALREIGGGRVAVRGRYVRRENAAALTVIDLTRQAHAEAEGPHAGLRHDGARREFERREQFRVRRGRRHGERVVVQHAVEAGGDDLAVPRVDRDAEHLRRFGCQPEAGCRAPAGGFGRIRLFEQPHL